MTRSLLLVHGWGGSFVTDWEHTGVAPALKQLGYDVPLIDILGHGTAERPVDPATYCDLAGDIRQQMPGGVVDAIGFSLGAKIVLELAAQSPTSFNRIVIIGVGANVFQPEAAAPAILAALDARASGRDEPRHPLAEYAIDNGNSASSVSACLKRPHNPALTSEKLSSITVPVLVICGGRDGIAYSPDLLMQSLPNAEATIFDNSDHLGLLADPRLIPLVVQFLQFPRESDLSFSGLPRSEDDEECE